MSERYHVHAREQRFHRLNMIRNMNSTFGLIFSQRAMLTLIEKGMTREQAYDLVQPKTA